MKKAYFVYKVIAPASLAFQLHKFRHFQIDPNVRPSTAETALNRLISPLIIVLYCYQIVFQVFFFLL